MTRTGSIRHELRSHVLKLLKSDDFSERLDELRQLPGRRVINVLIAMLLHADEIVKWRAVTGIGVVVETMAEKNREDARIIMRRLMWSLNDESGGIGWGAPEAMGEIIAQSELIASEFAPILVSYMDEAGNFLEHEPLQRGLLWGLARAAAVRPNLFEGAAPHLPKYLDSSDATVRGLAAWASGILNLKGVRSRLQSLTQDATKIRVYRGEVLEDLYVTDLAELALRRLNGDLESAGFAGNN